LFVIIKAGTIFPNTAKKYSDFEDWTCKGFGLNPDQVSIIAVQNNHKLPDPKECTAVRSKTSSGARCSADMAFFMVEKYLDLNRRLK
jgi:hypothetical protein